MIDFMIQHLGEGLSAFLGLQLLVCLISVIFASLKFYLEYVHQDKFQHIQINFIRLTVADFDALLSSGITAGYLPPVLRGMMGGPDILMWVIGIAVAIVGFPGFQYIHSILTWEREPEEDPGDCSHAHNE